jgi:DUF4097 and DUF4098 domain-containing protein YvlB
MMIRYVATLMFAFSAVALGASGNISKVNSSIRIDDGGQAGDVSTVNGSITIGRDASVREAGTVNGSIRLDERASAESVGTVNGAVTLGEGALVEEDVSAVNGKLTIRRGARVGGRLENVNGEFLLEGATVGGGIETVNGDIVVGAGSRVDGGITVEDTNSWKWRSMSRNPRLTIESGAVVNGPLRFEREVDLYLGDGVVTGPVEGVEPRRYPIGGADAG